MARYIDTDEAIQIIDNYAKAIDYDCDNCKVVIDAIKDIVSVICPTADVAEVVRCKECEYRYTISCNAKHERSDMDYCSHGLSKGIYEQFAIAEKGTRHNGCNKRV